MDALITINTANMKLLLPFSIILLLLSGCLKNEVVLDYSGIQPTILIPNANWPAKGYAGQPMDSAAGTTKLNLYARVSLETPLNKSVLVKFSLDNALVAAYNQKWGTSYQLLPANCFQAGTLELTIPAGEKQAILPITLVQANIDPANNYILPFTIESAEGYTIAANFKSFVFTLKGQ